MRQCEMCDKWYQDTQVKEVVVADHTEWWYCIDCICDNVAMIIEVLPSR